MLLHVEKLGDLDKSRSRTETLQFLDVPGDHSLQDAECEYEDDPDADDDYEMDYLRCTLDDTRSGRFGKCEADVEINYKTTTHTIYIVDHLRADPPGMPILPEDESEESESGSGSANRAMNITVAAYTRWDDADGKKYRPVQVDWREMVDREDDKNPCAGLILRPELVPGVELEAVECDQRLVFSMERNHRRMIWQAMSGSHHDALTIRSYHSHSGCCSRHSTRRQKHRGSGDNTASHYPTWYTCTAAHLPPR